MQYAPNTLDITVTDTEHSMLSSILFHLFKGKNLFTTTHSDHSNLLESSGAKLLTEQPYNVLHRPVRGLPFAQ